MMEHKKNRFRRLKLTGIAAVTALLLFVSCTGEPSTSGGAAEGESFSNPVKKAAFYDTSLHQDKLAIRYFDLEAGEKSGDAILLTAPDGRQLLVDAGIPSAGPQIEERLNKLGIHKLDAVLSTHPHIDHIGGLTTLLLTKPVGAYYHNGIPHDTETYRMVQKLLEDKRIPQTKLLEGDRLSWASDVTVEVLNPPVGTTPGSFEKWGTEELNNHSLVLLITHGSNRILLTGDLYKNQEYALVEKYGDRLQAKLLHAPHHGDMTSSSGPFIRSVRPEIVMISANVLQSLDILKRYEKENATVYSTGLNGNVLFVSDGEKVTVYPEQTRQNITKP